MKRHVASLRKSAGFTLLELVVSIVLSTIMIGLAANLMTTPVDAYFAQTRRSDLVDSSDLITRSLARDLDMAVSNSVRISSPTNRAIVEMLVADVVTFYRPSGSLGASGTWTAPDRELSFFTPADSRLSVFGRIDPTQTANSYTYPNRFLVVNNKGNATAYNAYRTNSRVITPTRVSLNIVRDPATHAMTGEEQLNFAPAFQFRNDSPSDPSYRLFLVRTPVSYICNAATRTLRRYENYAITQNIPAIETAPQLTASGVVNTLLSDDVRSCRLTCRGATTTPPCQSALIVDFSIGRTAQGNTETSRIYQQFRVDNQP